MPPVEPRFLGRYELLQPLASGGMAAVWLGRVTAAAGFERLVAIKRCHPHLREDPDFVAMFLDEARLAARIHHPHVVSTLDVIQTETELAIVMEYVEGGALSALLRAARNVPPPVLLRVVLDGLAGLEAAHGLADERGTSLELVHRDISPQNLMIGTDGLTRLADFGIAQAVSRLTVTRDGQVKGKAPYMAPEQLLRGRVGPFTDLYAMGAVLWEGLAGRRLFEGDDAQVISQVLSGGAAPLPPEVLVPDALRSALMTALHRLPEARFKSAADMARALESAGLTPASHRETGAFVAQTLAEGIAKTRSALEAATEISLEAKSPWRTRAAFLAASVLTASLAGYALASHRTVTQASAPAPRPAVVTAPPVTAPADAVVAAPEASPAPPSALHLQRVKKQAALKRVKLKARAEKREAPPAVTPVTKPGKYDPDEV